MTYQLDFFINGKLIASYRDTKHRLYTLTTPPTEATHWRLTQVALPRQLEDVPSGFYGNERREE